MSEIKLGHVAHLSLSAKPSALIAFILLWAFLSGVGVTFLRIPLPQAIIAGLVAALLHWCSETVHQLGHAWAARRTGYPMIGIRFWGLLSTSLYPPDEPALPAAIHIRRALGGLPASLSLALVAAALALALRPAGGPAWWVAVFFFLENLLVFGLGALLPLGFTDGSTLLQWRGK